MNTDKPVGKFGFELIQRFQNEVLALWCANRGVLSIGPQEKHVVDRHKKCAVALVYPYSGYALLLRFHFSSLT